MSLRIRTSFIDGKWLPQSGRVVVRENPGRINEVVTRYCGASVREARHAMDSAANAFSSWAEKPVPERIEYLERSLNILEANAGRIAKLITRENGKTISESHSEIEAGLRDSRHHLEDARKALRTRGRSLDARTSAVLRRESVGVYVLITPWNFPLATILRKSVPALAFGNTVVVKPSELTSGVACEWFKILSHSGLPAGVANLALGRGRLVGSVLLEHRALRGISFTGSTTNGLSIASKVAGRDVRLQIEMGGKNSLLVLADADQEQAVDAAIVAGFSCAGQWCTGTGRVIVEASIADAFCEALVERAKRISVGPGHLKGSHVGALVAKDRLQIARRVLKTAELEGARIACGGKEANARGTGKGYFFEPTVLTGVKESMGVFQEELFLPILPVAVARDFDDGLRMCNRGSLGLSASIFTRNREKAKRFCRQVEAGIVHANLHTAFRISELPVAAWRDSGRGTPECGDLASSFFTKPRVVYTNF